MPAPVSIRIPHGQILSHEHTQQRFLFQQIKASDAAMRYEYFFFFHFHKCGGSTVVATFDKAGFTMTPQNGQIRSRTDGKGAPKEEVFWPALDLHQQRLMIKEALVSGASFLTAERSFPRPEAIRLAGDELSIHLFTVLRHPWSRFVSNYRYSMSRRLKKGVNLIPMSEFWEKTHWSSNNFFVETILESVSAQAKNDAEKQSVALAWLKKLNSVVILERGELEPWLAQHGVTPLSNRVNASADRFDQDVSEEQFFEKNELDYVFYQEASRYFSHQNTRN